MCQTAEHGHLSTFPVPSLSHYFASSLSTQSMPALPSPGICLSWPLCLEFSLLIYTFWKVTSSMKSSVTIPTLDLTWN